jgi:hypothetical protein
MRTLIGVVAVMLLVGCIAPTMNETRQEGPRKILYSKKTDEAIAKCVEYEWHNLPVFGGERGATQQPSRDGGYTVFTVRSAYFVDIQPGASGSVAKYYSVLDNNWIYEKHLAALQSCL